MSKTALCVGEPEFLWPANAKLYVLSEPLNGILDRVVVATFEVPDAKDPDVSYVETGVYSETGTPIIWVDGRNHDWALQTLGYERVTADESVGLTELVEDIHSAAGGLLPGDGGVTWEAEIAATQLVNEAASAFLGDAGFGLDVSESVTNLAIAALRAALAYGVPIENLIAKKHAEMVGAHV